jgi:hypothetical protein
MFMMLVAPFRKLTMGKKRPNLSENAAGVR